MVVVLFGVSGAGKTYLGQRLAMELGWKFYDADQFHPPGNIDKLRRGRPLTDADRRPWLERVRRLIESTLGSGDSVVIACSALKAEYRNFLRIDEAVKMVYLKGDFPSIARRLRARKGHFMNPELLPSQFEMLEEPKGDALIVDAGQPPAAAVRTIRAQLGV